MIGLIFDVVERLRQRRKVYILCNGVRTIDAYIAIANV
jgi:hypothetical protein